VNSFHLIIFVFGTPSVLPIHIARSPIPLSIRIRLLKHLCRLSKGEHWSSYTKLAPIPSARDTSHRHCLVGRTCLIQWRNLHSRIYRLWMHIVTQPSFNARRSKLDVVCKRRSIGEARTPRRSIEVNNGRQYSSRLIGSRTSLYKVLSSHPSALLGNTHH